jgi:hypothetical protein
MSVAEACWTGLRRYHPPCPRATTKKELRKQSKASNGSFAGAVEHPSRRYHRDMFSDFACQLAQCLHMSVRVSNGNDLNNQIDYENKPVS